MIFGYLIDTKEYLEKFCTESIFKQTGHSMEKKFDIKTQGGGIKMETIFVFQEGYSKLSIHAFESIKEEFRGYLKERNVDCVEDNFAVYYWYRGGVEEKIEYKGRI
jgi:hypothetical protein